MSKDRVVFNYDAEEGHPFQQIPTIPSPKPGDEVDEKEVIEIEREPSNEEKDEVEIIEATSKEDEEEIDETDEGAEEETDEGTGDEEEIDEEEELNINFYIAKQLAEEGALPESLDISDKISYDEVISAYRTKMEERVLPELEQRAEQKIKEEGFDPTLAPYVRAYRNGMDPNRLTEGGTYESYASLKGQQDISDEIKLQTVKAAHTLKQLSEEESATLIADAQSKGEFDHLYDRSVDTFVDRWQSWQEQERVLNEQQRNQQTQQEEQSRQKIKSILSSGEILGEKISPVQAKEIEKSMAVADRIVDVGGYKERVSEIQEFLVNFYQNDELKLFAFKKWKYREQDKESIKNEIRQEIDNELESAMKKRVIKNNKALRKKKMKNELEKPKEDQTLHQQGDKQVMTISI